MYEENDGGCCVNTDKKFMDYFFPHIKFKEVN